jgi:hypothetical protein
VHLPEDGRWVTGTPSAVGCQEADVDGGRETRIECQVPEDCGGDICCGQRVAESNGTAYYTIVACAPTCTGGASVQLCDPALPSPCPPAADGGAEHCQQSMLLPGGYYICN